ncbi:catalase-related domain-containing protein [Clostridium botulinum]|nr:catalase-related domain-containing protein [Clostridium botulinum]
MAQAGEKFRTMKDKGKDTLVCNIAADMWEVDLRILLRDIENFSKADKDFGRIVKEALNINQPYK